MLAGLMTATVLGGIAPAYAQRGDDGGWRGRGGERAGRPEGGRGGQGNGQPQRQWQGGEMRQQRPERPAQVAQPQWRGNEARPDQRGPATVTRWNRDQQRFETTPRGGERGGGNWGGGDRGGGNWGGNDRDRQNWQDNRRDNDGRDWNRNDRNRNDRDRGGWDRRDDRNDRRWNDDDRRWNGGNPGWNNGRRFDDRTRWQGQRRWDNGWRNDRRYDWYSYRSRYGDRYRIGRYYAPRGWNYGYSRFSIGIFLNSLLYSNSYWIDDPYSYRLPPAYGSLRWIRYYDDALLVDIRDGYVVDVIHDFFW
ncbi:RcnB family protein [Sphingobium fuliginis]|nr:RcnB family protein [Sphingobium fuliginis]